MTGGRTGGGEKSRARRGTTRELAAATAWEDSRKKEEAAARGELALADRTARQHRRRAKKKTTWCRPRHDPRCGGAREPTSRQAASHRVPSSRTPWPASSLPPPSAVTRQPLHRPAPPTHQHPPPPRALARAATTDAHVPRWPSAPPRAPSDRGSGACMAGAERGRLCPTHHRTVKRNCALLHKKNRACGTPFESSGDLTRPHGESVQSQTSSSKN